MNYFRFADLDDEEIEDPTTHSKIEKAVFMVFYQGEQLKTRVKKICEGYHATVSLISVLIPVT